MSNWSDVNRLRLIEEYRKRPGLWCNSHPDYSSHEKRKEALAEITKNLNEFEKEPNTFTEEDIRNQFKNLKDMYRRKMKRLDQLKAMNHPIEEPSWFYFQRLKFLDSNRANEVESPTSFEPKADLDRSIDDLINAGFPSVDNLDKNQASTSASSAPTTERTSSNVPSIANDKIVEKPSLSKPAPRRGIKRSAELPIPEMHISPLNPVATSSIHPTGTAQMISSTSAFLTPPTITVQQDLAAMQIPQPAKISTPRSSIAAPSDLNDDLECWGRFVVSTVRKMTHTTPALAVEVKKRINDILYEVELRGLTSVQNKVSSPPENF